MKLRAGLFRNHPLSLPTVLSKWEVYRQTSARTCLKFQRVDYLDGIVDGLQIRNFGTSPSFEIRMFDCPNTPTPKKKEAWAIRKIITFIAEQASLQMLQINIYYFVSKIIFQSLQQSTSNHRKHLSKLNCNISDQSISRLHADSRPSLCVV